MHQLDKNKILASIKMHGTTVKIAVGLFILLIWLTQTIAHIQGTVMMGSDKLYLLDTIKSIFHADCINTNVMLYSYASRHCITVLS